ncbi:acyl-CoA thioesterase [Christiangramia sabulilitoris]|uniref:Acyl-CoA thioesterase n=1 Tax=Christiangramia sabulilitoris TaxID=2583991 RepID=A0A550I2V0_9FLAO|nr:acyl-CoA thioesterase [Christiangramia sabulilitoris]TRO65304.1 acyl-CoA thioesterase [Christiangramia sabulilitoris]
MEVTPEIYQKHLVVEKKHLDKQKHVNNVQYVQWVQDVAEEHWEKRATKEQKQDVLWVVVKHEISYKMEAFLGDHICLETYVHETTHVTSQRFVFIKNAHTGKLLAEAKTTWCLLDAKSKKPVKISEEMKQVFQQ